MEGKVPASWLQPDSDDEEPSDLTSTLHIGTGGRDMSRTIEVGDSVEVRANSKEWTPGLVVGTNTQHGLWRCFLVSVDHFSYRTLPCTERLLRLIEKGTMSAKKKREGNIVKVGGLGGGKTRTLRPVFTRRATGYQGPERFIPENGICFGDAGKLG